MAEFHDASRREYDVKPLLQKWQAFQALRYIHGIFEQARVDAGGYGASWNDDIDLACDGLYYGSP